LAMRILLIDPPYQIFTSYVRFYFPLGLANVAAVLRQHGHDVVIFDIDVLQKGTNLHFSEEYKRLNLYTQGLKNNNHWIWKEITRVLEDFKPQLVGITAMTMKFGSVIRVAEIVKQYDPICPVVVGGPHAYDWPEISLKSPHINFNLGGEAEDSAVKLLNAIEANSADFSLIEGLSYKNNGQCVYNRKTTPPDNLDRYPLPARDLLMHPLNYSSEDMGVIMTSRGCPFNCAFCSHTRNVRFRSIEKVLEEIRIVKNTYGTRQFAIKDDSFTVNKKRTIEICQRLINEKMNINWDCTTRVNLIDDELIDIMIRAGCNTIKVGIETGSEKILKDINKGITFEQARKVARMLNKHGIFWSAYFMYGLPDETEEDMLKTYQFMKELNPYYAGLGLYAPYPNTKLWNQGVQTGLVNPNVSLQHFFEVNPKDYFFKDSRKRVLNMQYEEFMQTAEFMMSSFHKHNTSIGNILRRAWARRKVYMADRKLFYGDAKKAINWLR